MMTTYHALLEATREGAGFVAEPELFPEPDHSAIHEMEIQSHWFAGHFPDELTTVDRRTVRIISPGEWNRGAGPDFIGASIEIDGQPFHGPIEIDVEAKNWDLHGHRDNAAFDTVILHLVLYDDGPQFFTRTSENQEVPRVVLSPSDVNAALGRPRLQQALARPGRCLTPLTALTPEAMSHLLEQAARHRARQKAARFYQTEKRHGFPQALWEAFADALGFAANRLPMRLLAQRVSVNRLAEFPSDYHEAILFGTAGFLSPELHEKAPTESRTYLENLWEHWWKVRGEFEFPVARQPKWQTIGSRPGNHPQRRLAALATALPQWKSLYTLARQAAPFTHFREALAAMTHDFWGTHHTLASRESSHSRRLIGESRVTEFLINTLYPLALAKDAQTWEPYTALKASAPNQKVKRCCERLFGSVDRAKPWLKKAWQHQALLQIYQDFCLEDLSDCTKCHFPAQLAEFRAI